MHSACMLLVAVLARLPLSSMPQMPTCLRISLAGFVQRPRLAQYKELTAFHSHAHSAHCSTMLLALTCLQHLPNSLHAAAAAGAVRGADRLPQRGVYRHAARHNSGDAGKADLLISLLVSSAFSCMVQAEVYRHAARHDPGDAGKATVVCLRFTLMLRDTTPEMQESRAGSCCCSAEYVLLMVEGCKQRKRGHISYVTPPCRKPSGTTT